MKRFNLFLGLLIALAGCNTTDACLTELDPWKEENQSRLNLSQCWTKTDLVRFYTTSLGSQLVPYRMVVSLELVVPDTTNANNPVFTGKVLFTKPHIEKRWRFLALEDSDWGAQSDVHKDDIAAGWPLGFVIDQRAERMSGRPEWRGEWLGLNCAACHTAQVEYQGKTLRVDGGPSMADISLFMQDLEYSLRAVQRDGEQDGAKFAEYAERYTKKFGHEDRKKLLDRLRTATDGLTQWRKRNDPPTPYGYARLDAFGIIFNEVIAMTGKKPMGMSRPDAPVSYPFLWHFSTHNQTQWNGTGMAVPMLVNVAGGLGIFAKYDPDAGWFEDPSTIRLGKLRELQELIDRLRSPKWPQGVMGTLEAEKVAEGKQLFEARCRHCHAEQRREEPLKRVKMTMVPVEKLRTDGTMVRNADHRTFMNQNGTDEARVPKAVGGATLDIILSSSHPGEILWLLSEGISMLIHWGRPHDGPDDYKARPLEGIWATAPYLHNGSVPNLYELLLPSEKRSKQFCVGSREFDPKHVGFQLLSKTECANTGSFWLDTAQMGNSNAGHDGDVYGGNLSEPQIWQLVEYMKSL